MGLFGLFKKGYNDVPPDVGKEAKSLKIEEAVTDPYDPGELEETKDEESIKRNDRSDKKLVRGENVASNIALQKLEAKIDSISSFLKNYGERITQLSQQIGEIRGMALSNEKSLARVMIEASKAVDIVREVRPDKLRIEYQRMDLKIQELGERFETNKHLMEQVMGEVKEMRRKINSFAGIEEVLRLNEEIKKDLIMTQQVASKARLHADKSEEIYIQLRRGFTEYQKLLQTISNFESNYSSLTKEVNRLKLDFSSIASRDDLTDLKKYSDRKFSELDVALQVINKVREDNVRIAKLIENTLAISKQNKEDIGNIAGAIGDDKIKKVSDYQAQIGSILKVIDILSKEVAEMKEVLKGKRKYKTD
jgi:hypothetical protein